MNHETRQEVIKALAYGMDDEEVANFAEITLEELATFKLAYAAEIEARRKEAEEFGV